MTLDDLRERFKSEGMQFLEKIQESSLYLTIKDRYDAQSPGRQKILVSVIVILTLLFVFSFPYSYFSSSSEQITEYEGKKELIRDLLRAYKESSEQSLSVRLPATAEVRSQVESFVQSMSLLPEQNGGINITIPNSQLLKTAIIDGVIEVSTVQLNLKQIVTLGANLVKIQGTKLKDLVMTANAKDPRYFDTIFRVVVFKGEPPKENTEIKPRGGAGSGVGTGGPAGIPPPPPPPAPGAKRKGGK